MKRNNKNLKNPKNNGLETTLSLEDEAELNKLAEPSASAKIRKKQSLFSTGCTIQNGISGDSSKNKEFINKCVLNNLNDMQKQTFLIGGDSRFFYPDVEIAGSTLHSPTEKKFFSMIIPSCFVKTNSKPFRYFLRKGEHKSDNETLFEIEENSLEQIVEIFSHEFLPYLKSVDGKKINSLADIPQAPKPVTLKENAAMKLVFRIDDLTEEMIAKPRASFNLSLREWEFSPNRKTWFRTKRGITMSALNFNNFVFATIKLFGEHVHEMFNALAAAYNDTLNFYEPSEEEDSDSAMIEDGEDQDDDKE